jgi:hypothetical protein
MQTGYKCAAHKTLKLEEQSCKKALKNQPQGHGRIKNIQMINAINSA